MPPQDQQTAPTRGDLALLIGTRAGQIDAALAILTAAVVNLQGQVTALDARLTAAGLGGGAQRVRRDSRRGADGLG